MGLGRYVEPIPHAVLAGILMKVGWDIIDWRLLARVHRIQRTHLLVMLATLSLTVFVDLVTAVGIGLIAAGMANPDVFFCTGRCRGGSVLGAGWSGGD